MQFSQRTARSEIHFYIQKLLTKGYKKVKTSHHKGGCRVVVERVLNGHKDVLTIKYSNNGWCSITNGDQTNQSK